MRLIRLKTAREIMQTGLFKLDFHGNMIGFTRKGQEGATHYLHSEYFGETVLMTDHVTIHTNAVRVMPEIIAEDLKVGYVSDNVYKRTCERLSNIEKIIHNKYEHTILVLKEKLGAKQSTVKLNARIKALESQLELSKKFTQEWRNEAHNVSKGIKLNVSQARKDENKELQELGENIYKEQMCKT